MSQLKSLAPRTQFVSASLLAVAALNGAVLAQSQDFGTRLDSAIEISRLPIPVGDTRFLTCNENSVAVLVRRDGAVGAGLYDLTGRIRFEVEFRSDTIPRIFQLALSDNGATVVATGAASSESLEHIIVDSSGRELSRFPTDCYLEVSPGGRYLCTQQNSFCHGWLGVFDLRMTPVMTYLVPNAEYRADFVGDSTLMIADADSLRVFAVPSGTVLVTTSLNADRGPFSVLSRDDSVIVYWTQEVAAAFRTSGDLLWMHKSSRFISTAAIESGGGRVAFLMVDLPSRSGFLEVRNIQNGDVLVQSGLDSKFGSGILQATEHAWFVQGVVTLWGPIGGSAHWFDDPDEYWTAFLDLGESNPSSDVVFRKGLYRPVPGDGPLRFFRISRDSPPTLLQVD